MQMGKRARSIALFIGSIVAPWGCSGKVETASKLASTCSAGGCEDSGAGGAPAESGSGGATAADGGAAAGGGATAAGGATTRPTDAGTADVTIPLDASSTSPDPCPAVPAASCGTLSTLVNPVPGWSIDRALVPRTGVGWVVEATRPNPVGVGQGSYMRAFYVAAANQACAVPVSEEVLNTSPTWYVDDAAMAGSTRAAVLLCAYKSPCGAELHRNGVRLADLNATVPPQAVYGGVRHRVAVRADGELVVVSGFKTDISPPPVASFPLTLSWYAPDDKAEGGSAGSESQVSLLAAAAVDAGSFQGVAVALRAQNDGGTGPGHVDLFTRSTELAAQWHAPPEVALTVDGLAVNDTALGVLGTVSATQKPWLAVLDLPTLAVRFQVTVDEPGTEAGVSLVASGAVLGFATDTSLALREYDLTGANPKTVATFPHTPRQNGVNWPPTFGAAATGSLAAWNADVAHCDTGL